MRRVIYEADPDRRVIYEFAPGVPVVETDRGPLFEEFVMRVEQVDQHALEIAIRIVDAQPVVERVSVVRNPDAGWIEASDLARVNLSELFDLIAGDTRTVDYSDFGAMGEFGVMPASGYGSAAVAGLRRKRSEIGPARLREVAIVYRELWSDELSKTDAMEAIAGALGVSVSQTYRLIARAKAKVDPDTGKPYIPAADETEDQ
jgi:hypothetical protein